MNILIVGGTGMIGGHAALHLRTKGHQVTVAGRHPPAAGTPLAELDFLRVDFIADDPPNDRFRKFDAMVFAAGNDIRHVPKGASYYEHVHYANAVAQPRFFAAARDAGIRQLVNIGSFYPHVAPKLMANNPYMRSRQAAHEGMCALMSDRFRVISIDAPFVIGAVLGALAGAIMAPKIAVTLGIGVEVIVLAFAVVAIGGMGSIQGALVGALIVGICRAAAVHLVPQVELFVIYGVMALVLLIRPYGLFVRAQPRKI